MGQSLISDQGSAVSFVTFNGIVYAADWPVFYPSVRACDNVVPLNFEPGPVPRAGSAARSGCGEISGGNAMALAKFDGV
jgi:hypothetical protein